MGLVTCYDADGNPHEKEPVDARECCLHCGFTMTFHDRAAEARELAAAQAAAAALVLEQAAAQAKADADASAEADRAAQAAAAALVPTNDQLRESLTARGIVFPSNANKAELQALLADAPTA